MMTRCDNETVQPSILETGGTGGSTRVGFYRKIIRDADLTIAVNSQTEAQQK